MRHVVSCTVILLLFSLPACAAGKLDLKAGVKLLFLDDYALVKKVSLTRTMHQPEKKGAVLKPDMSMHEFEVQTISAPVWVESEKLFKLFYMTFPYKNGRWVEAGVRPALAVSKDGVNFTRPVLGLCKYDGSTQNNLFYVQDPKARWTKNKFMDVIYDPHDPNPQRRYKGLLGAIGREPVVSSDGVNWKKVNTKKIQSSDTSCLFYDELSKRYVAIVKTGTKFGRSAAVAFSKDFVTWTKPRISFHTDHKDQRLAIKRIRERLKDPDTQKPLLNDPDPATGWKPPKQPRHLPTWRAETYNLAIFPYEGVYIGLPQIYYPTGQDLPARNNTVGFHEVQLIFSRDSQLRRSRWKRLGNRKPFIETSKRDKGLVGVFDRQQLGMCNRPIVRGDELWFYYPGSKSRATLYQRNPDGSKRDHSTLTPAELADYNDGTGAICLATLRLDGFVSLDADEKGGYAITKPFDVTGNELYLNVDVKDGGYAKVEVLDEDGQALMGFEKDDCVSLEGSAVKQQVAWQTGSYWQLLAGQTIQLKMYLKNASLYSFWTE